jgi:hypothetical protein
VVNVASGLAHLAVPFATAYCMSKRGLVAYSDALRLEFGGELTVTTVYPGYIRTGIHAASKDSGVGLEGAVPAERVEDAARALTRAALGRPVRDLATTRSGTIQYFLARRPPLPLIAGSSGVGGGPLSAPPNPASKTVGGPCTQRVTRRAEYCTALPISAGQRASQHEAPHSANPALRLLATRLIVPPLVTRH